MTYQPKVYREQGGSRQVIASGGSLDVASGGEIDIESGGALKLAGTAVTSTAAELNALDGITSTVAELNILDGVTSTAAELNLVDGSVAGTAVASKALVLGTNKNVDTLAIADSGLKLGAGAGTAVTATAAELNILDGVTSTAAELNILDGVTATAAELNASSAAASLLADGLVRMGVARATYDYAEHGGAISAIGLGVTLPDNALVIGGFIDVITTCTSEGADGGTMAISVEGANDIVSAIAISDGSNPWDAGKKAIIPKSNTPESTSVKTTAARAITATIAAQTFTAGKFVVFLHYVVSD